MQSRARRPGAALFSKRVIDTKAAPGRRTPKRRPSNRAADAPNGHDRQQPANRRSKPRRPFADAKRLERADDHPVKQCRFLKPGVTAKRRRNQIVIEKHLARHLRVARFVWSKQGQFAKSIKVKDDDDAEE